ncbi:MAG TPA: prolyl oligopeptidase family serine peptidase [Actinomycetes bacterium]|nr:prolyl oligopeptidase family serine peptidase [Actinomycetes bacterium]
MSQPPIAAQQPYAHTEHGVERPDPYAWLKAKTSDESLAYLRAERTFYDEEMAPLKPLVDDLTREMIARVPQTEDSARWREGDFEYFTRAPERQEYPQLLRVDSAGHESVVLDQNTLVAPGEYVEVGVRLVSPDGSRLAYSVDVTGDEVYELRFRDIATGQDLDDTVARTYYGGAWSADGSTFFYVVHDEVFRPYQVWRHVVGTPSSDDALVFEDLDTQFDVVAWGDRAGDLIVIRTFNRNTSEVWLVDSRRPQEPAWVVTPRRRGHEYTVAHLPGSDRGELLVVSNDGATEFRLMRGPVTTSAPEAWIEVVPEAGDERLHDVDVFAEHVVLSTVSAGQQLLRILPRVALQSGSALDLQSARVVEAGVPAGLLELWHNEEPDVTAVLIEVESYVEPGQCVSVDLESGERTVVHRRELPHYDIDDYITEFHWVTARDGERVPVKLARHRDTELDGSAPLLLYAYGAYESSFWPGFDGSLPSLLDRGVVFAHALIRGGGEMGRRWYLDGYMLTKRNTFTDFIDVADGLANEGLIDGSRIVSRGLSAGGLLQGAVYAMRPERWRAVVAEVPFVDTISSMLDHSIPLTANEVDEWGDPRIKEQFDYMLTYSPYENVPSTDRPELLATGALHDPRVLVHEPAKWVARIRATAGSDDARTLFRAELGEGGHSGPTGRFAHLAYEAEVAAFILQAVDKVTT